MGYLDSLSSSLSSFSNLINNQINQNNFNDFINSVNKANSTTSTGNTSQSPQQNTALSSALSSLSGLLGSNSTSATAPVDQKAYIMDKLVQSGADATKLNNLIGLISGDTDDIAYTRTGPNDPNITLQNRNPVYGQDVQAFLTQAVKIAQSGQDLNKYIDTATDIVTKGDYDDLRRFISVTDTAMYATNSSYTKDPTELNKFFDFTEEVLNKRHYDVESNIFDLQTMMGYGATLETSIGIMENMENTGLEGRNNMVDLNRVIIDAKNKKLFLPYLLDQMEKSGDTRKFLDDYMAHNNMQTTAPDFTKFDRIERIDGEDMVIHQGDSAALFAQAISSTSGLLPQSSLYWSSLQTGAISNGSSYLDLSKLGPGTYDIYVKVGPGYGGTDTAKKRVVILPKDEPSDPVVLSNDGKLKITVEKGSAGLSSDLYMSVNNKEAQLITTNAQTNTGFTTEEDYKDGDQIDFFIRTHGDSWGLGTYDHGTDTENSPSGKAYYQKEQIDENSWRIRFEDLPEGQSDFDYDDVVIKVELIKNQVQPTESASVPVQPVASPTSTDKEKKATSDLASLLSAFQVNDNEDDKEDNSDFAGMEKLYKLMNNKVNCNDVCDLLDKKVGKDKVVQYLNDNGHDELAKKYQKKQVSWSDTISAFNKDQEFYQKSLAEFRRYVDKEETRKFFERKRCNDDESSQALGLLGYNTQNTDVSVNTNVTFDSNQQGNQGHNNNNNIANPERR